MNDSKNWIQILKNEMSRPWAGPGPAHNGSERAGRVPEWQCEPAQGRLTSLFKTWIQFLELFILIQNAYVFPNTILKHLYWSEFGFLVLLWSFFHLFTFLKSKQFQSEPAQGRPTLKISGIWKKRKSENLVIRKQEIQILVNTNF